MGAQHESYASTSASARSRKRKVHDYRGKSAGDFDYDHDHDHDHEEHKPKKSKKKAEIAEKRLRKLGLSFDSFDLSLPSSFQCLPSTLSTCIGYDKF